MGKRAEVKTEIKRTCNRCGTERYVSLEDARTKMPDARTMKWVGLASVIGSKSQRSTFASQRTALELQKSRVAAAMRCPQCGSESFSEIEVPVASSAALPPGSGAAFRRAKRTRRKA